MNDILKVEMTTLAQNFKDTEKRLRCCNSKERFTRRTIHRELDEQRRNQHMKSTIRLANRRRTLMDIKETSQIYKSKSTPYKKNH
nr:MAG: hypothetical protein CM15mV30_0930 [uncultured marine virus]